MLFTKFTGGSEQADDVTRSKHTPASNTAAVVTLAAVDDFTRHVLHRVVWSYNTSPSGGRITISDGGTTFFDIDITVGGPGSFHFSTPCDKNSQVVVTLGAGGSGVTGKLYVESSTAK